MSDSTDGHGEVKALVLRVAIDEGYRYNWMLVLIVS